MLGNTVKHRSIGSDRTVTELLTETINVVVFADTQNSGKKQSRNAVRS